MSSISLAALATLLCMLASSGYAWFVFRGDETVVLQKAVVSAMLLPVLIGAPAYYVIARKIRALNFRNLRLQALTRRDGLTRCLNKTAFQKSVESYLHRGPRHASRRKGALLVIDADNFKLINDRFGHETGDRAIKLIAEKVRSVVRGRDCVGRIGGEEFAVLLQDADQVIAAAVAERIRAAVQLSDLGIANAALSVSVGGVVFHDEVKFSAIFRRADTKLYEAKANGRNQVMIAGPAINDYAPRSAA